MGFEVLVDKPFWKSKTLQGVAIIAIVHLFSLYSGIDLSEQVLETINVLAGSWGVYGIRDFLARNSVEYID